MTSACRDAPTGMLPGPLGRKSSAFACSMDTSRLLRWKPVLIASTPFSPGQSTARWYSGLSGSRRMGEPARRTESCACRQASERRPCSLLTAGSTKSAFVTRQLTGLPGRPKKYVLPGLLAGSVGSLWKEAKQVGLPGFMLSLEKCTCPISLSRGFTKSAAPIDTPPEEITTSHCAEAASRRRRSSSLLSGTMPRSSTLPCPASVQAAINARRLQSRTCAPTGVSQASTSSLPVDITPITGLAKQRTSANPVVASTPSSQGPSTCPLRSSASPSAMSLPISRTFSPAATASLMVMTSPTRWVTSTLTTAFAPSGSIAPVVM
mmetsp:Transcript_27286/g.60411  ORF Transcript_27286/g.60411 Transcript_27286/m.60411 type:complete len:321 (-) Transcript_27286:273-1235(-)